MYYSINLRGNSKTHVPTTSSSLLSCPTICPLKNNGCYAENYPMKFHVKTLDTQGITWNDLLNKIKSLPKNTLWRHNASGDLHTYKHTGSIQVERLVELCGANKNKHGFTYTHVDITNYNMRLIQEAIDLGFVINISIHTFDDIDRYKTLYPGIPQVVVLPYDIFKNCLSSRDIKIYTPNKHRITICPNQRDKRITCAMCKLCSNPKRKSVVGFVAHGTKKGSIKCY